MANKAGGRLKGIHAYPSLQAPAAKRPGFGQATSLPPRVDWCTAGNLPPSRFTPVPDFAACRLPLTRVTMWYMDTTLNVRIPAALKKQLDALSRRQHRPSSELVRESLRRYIAAEQIARLRKMTVPLAEAQGFITDDDIFTAVS